MDSVLSASEARDGRNVACLRAVLRGQTTAGAAESERAVTELTEALQGPLFRYCAGLVRGGGDGGGAAGEAEALALAAWNRAIARLAGPRGDRVSDLGCLWRVLRVEARAALLAAAAAATPPRQEEITAAGRTLGRRPKNRPCPPRREPTLSLSPRWAALPGTWTGS